MSGLMNEDHTFLYDYAGTIPQTVTLSSYTTGMEQLRLSSDNLTKVMVKDILPQVVDPKIKIGELYEPDYYLMLRHERILTWGPFFTAYSYFCTECKNEDGGRGKIHMDTIQVNLSEIPVVCPENKEELVTEYTIPRSDFIFFDGAVTLHLNRCKDLLLHSTPVTDGKKNLLPLATAISAVEGRDFIDVTEAVDWLASLAPADFKTIQEAYKEHFSIGLKNRAEFTCPVCGGRAWCYVPVNDNYFRPTKEDLKEWKKLLARTESAVRPDKQ